MSIAKSAIMHAHNNAIIEVKRRKIKALLEENKMHYEFTVDSNGFIEITVTDGDWKHDHIALQNAMKKAGYISFGRHIIEDDEDNGDDSFSAIYLYR